jgi:hypothetical protein
MNHRLSSGSPRLSSQSQRQFFREVRKNFSLISHGASTRLKYNSMALNSLRNPHGDGRRFALVGRGRCPMLACNKLCIDPCDGSPVLDFRIENGCVESCTRIDTTQRWQQLTPEQLTSHVMSNTVVAQWLLGRMGVHRLVRACNSACNSEDASNGMEERSERRLHSLIH